MPRRWLQGQGVWARLGHAPNTAGRDPLHRTCTETPRWESRARAFTGTEVNATMHPFVRLLGIMAVFTTAAIGWLILGVVMSSRTSDQRSTLEGRVADLWGSPQAQAAPTFELHWRELETKSEQITDQIG